MMDSTAFLIIVPLLLVINIAFVQAKRGRPLAEHSLEQTLGRAILAQCLWGSVVIGLTLVTNDSMQVAVVSPVKRAFVDFHPASVTIVVAYGCLVFNSVVAAVRFFKPTDRPKKRMLFPAAISWGIGAFAFVQLLRP